jgi:putative hydroxymethylpyrimidine transport system substrate-binding protein
MVMASLLALLASGCVKREGMSSNERAKLGERQRLSLFLDWYYWGNHCGLLLGKDSGLYEKAGLDLQISVPENPEDGMKLVIAGKADLCISYETDVILAREKGAKIRSIAALVQRPLNTIMTLKSSGITSPRQLKGKTVASAGLPSDEALLRTVLARERVSLSDVKVVPVSMELTRALISGKYQAIIGGYWVHESILLEQTGYPVNVMRVDDYGVPPYYELVLVASEDCIRKKPRELRAFLRASAEGYAAAANDPKAALQSLLKASPKTDAKLESKGIELLAPLWKDSQKPWGWQDFSRWDAYAKWLFEQGILKNPVKGGECFTNQFLKDL